MQHAQHAVAQVVERSRATARTSPSASRTAIALTVTSRRARSSSSAAQRDVGQRPGRRVAPRCACAPGRSGSRRPRPSPCRSARAPVTRPAERGRQRRRRHPRPQHRARAARSPSTMSRTAPPTSQTPEPPDAAASNRRPHGDSRNSSTTPLASIGARMIPRSRNARIATRLARRPDPRGRGRARVRAGATTGRATSPTPTSRSRRPAPTPAPPPRSPRRPRASSGRVRLHARPHALLPARRARAPAVPDALGGARQRPARVRAGRRRQLALPAEEQRRALRDQAPHRRRLLEEEARPPRRVVARVLRTASSSARSSRATRAPSKGRVVAFNVEYPRVRWSRTLPSRTETSPIVVGGTRLRRQRERDRLRVRRRRRHAALDLQRAAAPSRAGSPTTPASSTSATTAATCRRSDARSGRKVWSVERRRRRVRPRRRAVLRDAVGRVRPRLPRQHERQHVLVRHRATAQLAWRKRDRQLRLLVGGRRRACPASGRRSTSAPTTARSTRSNARSGDGPLEATAPRARSPAASR